MKNSIELKREYWSQQDLMFTPKMIEALVHSYGATPATFGEAMFVLKYRIRELVTAVKGSIR